MIEDELIINGEKYILEKSINYNKNIASIGVMDCANVCLFVQILEEYIEGSKIIIPKPNLAFKKSDDINDCKLTFNKNILITNNGTNISYNYVEFADKLFKLFNGSKRKKINSFELYELYDEKLDEFKKNSPILLYDGRYALIIAPRNVEN